MKPYLKMSLWYLGFGVAWIFASDRVIGLFTSDAAVWTQIQTAKGWLFVAVSAFLVHQLGRQAYRRQEAQSRERTEVFKKTVEGAHHILLNYLNQMELVMLEASHCEGFDAEVYKIGREISDEAASEIVRLGAISEASTQAIDAFVYRHLRGRKAAAELETK